MKKSLDSLDYFNYWGLDWIGMIFLLLGVFFLSEQKKFGFVLSAISNIFWVGFGILSESLPTIVLNLGLLGLNTKGYFKWKRD